MAEVCTPSGGDSNIQFAHGNVLITDSRGKFHLTLFCMISSCPTLADLSPWPLNGLSSPMYLVRTAQIYIGKHHPSGHSLFTNATKKAS